MGGAKRYPYLSIAFAKLIDFAKGSTYPARCADEPKRGITDLPDGLAWRIAVHPNLKK
jgi:hypothetical protein